MSHVFVGEAVIPGKDDAVQLLCAFPEFADVMGVADNRTFDCRNPDRVNLPGQGRRPSKILAALREKSWHRRNYGLACLNDGVVADGGIFTVCGAPILGISQNHWEKKYASTEKRKKLPMSDLKRIDGRCAILPFCKSARYSNYFHFITEYLALAPGCLELAEVHGIDKIIITVERPEPGGFHDGLLRQFFRDRFDDLIFEPGPFKAEMLAFPVDRCGIYARDIPQGHIRWAMEKNMGMTFMSRGLAKVFDTVRPTPHTGSPPILVVSRERANARRLLNEAALVKALAPFGAIKVNLEDYSIPEQVRLVSGAKILIGCHGAGMINAGFLSHGSKAIELTSRQYLPRAFDFAGLSALCGIGYHVFLCDETGEFIKENKLVGNVGNDIIVSPETISQIVEMCS